MEYDLEKKRIAALAWTPEQISEKQKNIINSIDMLKTLGDTENADLCKLLSCHNAITPEIQRSAMAAKIFDPAPLYYHAPEDVRNGLIAELLSTTNPREADMLLQCLAFQGDDRSLEALLELEKNPLPWRQELYIDPSVYAQLGGWTFDKNGHRTELIFNTCYPMIKSDDKKTPVRIGTARKDTCPHCDGNMVDMLILDGRDERLKFLGIDGILTATCCPSCIAYLKTPAFNRFTLDGGTEVFPSEIIDGITKKNLIMSPEDYKALTENSFVLGNTQMPLFYGALNDDVNTIGGFANWVEDWEYTVCPHCGRYMKYLAQIQYNTMIEYGEGTIYIEFCPDCQIVSMQYSQS